MGLSLFYSWLFFVVWLLGKSEWKKKNGEMLGDGIWREDLGDLAIRNYNP